MFCIIKLKLNLLNNFVKNADQGWMPNGMAVLTFRQITILEVSADKNNIHCMQITGALYL